MVIKTLGRYGFVLAFAVLIFLALAVLTHAKNERPNIIMIVVDDMRFDEFSAGGHPLSGDTEHRPVG